MVKTESDFGAIHLRRPLVEGRGVIDFKMFWDEGREGVPLVYDVTNEKINSNQKQSKEMKLNKGKYKNNTKRWQLCSKLLNGDALLAQ